MELENVTNPTEAPAEAEVAADENTTSEAEAPETDPTEQEGEAQEPEFEEVEFNGNRYKVPKEIAPAIMKNADYTQKTQALAEERRVQAEQIAQERERIQREAEISEAIQDDIAQFRAVKARLNALQNVNAYSLPPAEQQRYILELNHLQMAHGELDNRINSRKSELEAEREQSTANAISKAVETLKQPDEAMGWAGKYDEATDQRLGAIAREIGLTNNDIKQFVGNPVFYKSLNLIGLGLETLKKQRAAITTPKQPEAKPVPQVGGAKAKGNVDPDKMSIDEWNKWRSKQVFSKKA